MAMKAPVQAVEKDQHHSLVVGKTYTDDHDGESTPSYCMETRERATGASTSFELIEDTLPSLESQPLKRLQGEDEEKVQQLEKQIQECNEEKQELIKEIEHLKQTHMGERKKLQHDLALAKETIEEARRDKDQLTEILKEKDEQMRCLEEKITSLCEEKDRLIMSELSSSHGHFPIPADHDISKLQLGVQSMQVDDHDGLPSSKGLVPGIFAKLPLDQVDKLKKYIINAQKFRQLGVGTYGTVWELLVDGTKKAAGKEFRTYDAPVSRDEQVSKFCKEIHILLGLDHEHIVSYLGMCPVPGSQSFLPMLVMELLKTNLHDYLLDGSQRPSSSITVAILLGISKGLAYLHAKAVLHRDLTAKNILLTSDTVAKISDFGNSKIIESDVISQLDSMTPIPGTRYYMPPEAETGSYSFSLDIFSFGHLALFTITRKYLRSLPAPKFYEGGECKGCSEVDRRFMSFDIIKKQLGEDHILTSLITKCLDDDAKNRPTAEELITTCKLNSSQLWIDPDDPYTVRLYDDDIN